MIRAIFHWSGNSDSLVKLLIRNVSGEAIYSATGLINETRKLSYLVEQSFGSDLRHLSTSLYVAFRSLKLIGLLVSEFI